MDHTLLFASFDHTRLVVVLGHTFLVISFITYFWSHLITYFWLHYFITYLRLCYCITLVVSLIKWLIVLLITYFVLLITYFCFTIVFNPINSCLKMSKPSTQYLRIYKNIKNLKCCKYRFCLKYQAVALYGVTPAAPVSGHQQFPLDRTCSHLTKKYMARQSRTEAWYLLLGCRKVLSVVDSPTKQMFVQTHLFVIS